MKTKLLLILFTLLLFTSQTALASYSDSDTLKAIILSKKSNLQNMKRIEVGEKIAIIRKGDRTKITGEVTQITNKSIYINNIEFEISKIETIEASRRNDFYFETLFSFIIFTLSSLAIIALFLSMILGVFTNVNFEIMYEISMPILSITAVISFYLFEIYGIMFLYNKYLPKKFNLRKWDIDIVNGKKRQTRWERVKNFFGI